MLKTVPTQSPVAAPSRRGFFVGASAATLAPFGAVASPLLEKPEAGHENPRLLAIGEELDSLLNRHAAADAALQASEELALATCPSVPESMKPDADHPHFRGSVRVDLDIEVNALGDPVGPFHTIRGQQHPIGTVASSRAIEKIIACAYEPEAAREQMRAHLAIARTYEAEREAALLSAGLPQAVAELNAAARAVWNLIEDTRQLPASGRAGVLIKARVLKAAASVWDQHGCSNGRLLIAAASQDFIDCVVEALKPAPR